PPSELTQLAEHHLTYPLLHYFQSADVEAAIAPAVARFDEAMMLLHDVVEPSVQPPTSAVEPVRVAVTSFLATLPEVFLAPAEDVPPSPPSDELKAARVPCRPPEEVEEILEQHVEHRRLLRGLVRSSGWSWEASVG
ncbi:MAG: two pore domain potassium channel family protein, partial [Actinomycetota bacterium]|nr:two pore domain potassium channel family protein [Actinomycetota bacterium]